MKNYAWATNITPVRGELYKWIPKREEFRKSFGFIIIKCVATACVKTPYRFKVIATQHHREPLTFIGANGEGVVTINYPENSNLTPISEEDAFLEMI